MNRVEISTSPAPTDGLTTVVIEDDYASSDFIVNSAALATAKAAGHRAVLDLICAETDPGCEDILEAAVQNNTDIILDGENAALTDVIAAMTPAPSLK